VNVTAYAIMERFAAPSYKTSVKYTVPQQKEGHNVFVVSSVKLWRF